MRGLGGLRAWLARRWTLEQYRIGVTVLPRLPGWLVDLGTRLLAGTLALRRGEQRLIVERNLRRLAAGGAEPEGKALRRAVRATFVAYGRYYVDCARLAAATPEQVDAGFTCEDYDNISNALRIGPGAILALPHVGSWEWAGAWLAQRPGVKVVAVVEPISHPELFEWMGRYRRRIGIDVVPAGPEALGTLTRALSEGFGCLPAHRPRHRRGRRGGGVLRRAHDPAWRGRRAGPADRFAHSWGRHLQQEPQVPRQDLPTP